MNKINCEKKMLCRIGNQSHKYLYEAATKLIISLAICKIGSKPFSFLPEGWHDLEFPILSYIVECWCLCICRFQIKK